MLSHSGYNIFLDYLIMLTSARAKQFLSYFLIIVSVHFFSIAPI
ncbi:MAG: hypothetical protein ACHQD8_00770 [Chitinophagales bacterium]